MVARAEGVPALSKSKSVALVALATALMSVSYLDRQAFAALSPTITAALNISDKSYGVLGSIFSIGYLLGPPFAGLLIDRVGVRRGLPMAMLLWSVVAALHAGAMGFVSFVVLRLALGVAEAPSFPGAARVVHQSVAAKSAPRAFGFLFTGSSLGAIVAPPVASWLAVTFGWRFAFVGVALVGIMWIPIWLAVASETEARARLEAAPADAKEKPSVLETLRQPPVWRCLISVMACSPVPMFALIWAPKFLVSRYHLTQLQVGKLMWLPPLLFDLGAVVLGDLGSRLRGRNQAERILFAVGALFCTVIGLVPFVGTEQNAVYVIGIALFGTGGLFALQSAEALARVPNHLVTVSAGALAAAQSVAYIVSSIVVGLVVGGAGGYDAALFGIALWVFPGALAWAFWPKHLVGGRAA